jgi:hypothetical protein
MKTTKLSQLIGQGRDRYCYAHPENPTLCIKIARHSEQQSARERKYIDFLKKRGTDLSNISCHAGLIQTNKGTGHLFELLRLENGNIAPTLKSVIQTNQVSIDECLKELQKLKSYLIVNNICVRDLSPTNIVCDVSDTNNIRFVIIDGIGSPNFNPLTIRWSRLTKKAIERAWARLERKAKQLATSL